MEEFNCLQSYIGVLLSGELPLVWCSRGLWVTVLLQRVNIRPIIHQTRSPHCFRYGINRQILFEVRMRSGIERVIEGLIVTIQMWITPISSSSRSAAVITETIEVDTKPFKSILPFKVKLFQRYTCMYKQSFIAQLPCLLFVLKNFRVINFRRFHYPQNFFNNEIFPDYSIPAYVIWYIVSKENICT